MMGTIWLRLSNHQSSIQPFINAIFFGGAFMSFMTVAYIPAIIEGGILQRSIPYRLHRILTCEQICTPSRMNGQTDFTDLCHS